MVKLKTNNDRAENRIEGGYFSIVNSRGSWVTTPKRARNGTARLPRPHIHIKQLLDEVEHDIMNDQNRGLRYLPKPKAKPDNTDTRF